jgi:DNA-directed RNA polymerase subunit beta'
VEELFEARRPKGQAIISEIDGVVHIEDQRNKSEIQVVSDTNEVVPYSIPWGARLKVTEGSRVSAGDELTEGSINPHELLKIKGVRAAQIYLLHEVQRVYRLQGVDINDKHIEVIIRQIFKKVKVEDPGDTDLLSGELVNVFDFEDANRRALEEGLEPAVARPALLGITKASLATDSFLSAASFQETTRVLTEAAIKGRQDSLLGLKENVIIGKLIPAGTGMGRYRNIQVVHTKEEEEASLEEDVLKEDETGAGQGAVDTAAAGAGIPSDDGSKYEGTVDGPAGGIPVDYDDKILAVPQTNPQAKAGQKPDQLAKASSQKVY